MDDWWKRTWKQSIINYPGKEIDLGQWEVSIGWVYLFVTSANVFASLQFSEY